MILGTFVGILILNGIVGVEVVVVVLVLAAEEALPVELAEVDVVTLVVADAPIEFNACTLVVVLTLL